MYQPTPILIIMSTVDAGIVKTIVDGSIMGSTDGFNPLFVVLQTVPIPFAGGTDEDKYCFLKVDDLTTEQNSRLNLILVYVHELAMNIVELLMKLIQLNFQFFIYSMLQRSKV